MMVAFKTYLGASQGEDNVVADDNDVRAPVRRRKG